MISGSRRQARQARVFRNALVLAAYLATTVLVAPAIADVLVGSRMLADVDSLGVGIEMLDFDSGTSLPVGGPTAWNAGTPTDIDVATDGSLALDHRGDAPPGSSPSWWDTSWSWRQCFVAENPGAAAPQLPVRVRIDSTAPFAAGELPADGAGLRAVSTTSGTDLPLWVEGTIPATSTSIWVQLVNAPTGPVEFCLYWGNVSAPTVSDQSSVFTLASPTLRYYTLTDNHTGTGTGGQLSVVSYVDGNQITVDGVSQTGNRGQVLTFTGVDRNSVITATGPLSGSGLGNATDSIVPEAYADTEFIFPTTRNIQTIWVRAPLGDVDLQFRAGNTVTTQTVTAAQGSVGIVADALGSNAVGGSGEGTSVRSTNGVPFLAVVTSQSNDSILGVPFTGEPLFGMRSRDLRVGAGSTGATFDLQGSDGTDLFSESVAAGFVNSYYAAAETYGDGTGFRISPVSGRTAAVQQADGNGSESTAFLPTSLLDDEYFTPENTKYVSVVCPVPGQGVTMTLPNSTVTSFSCDNPGGVPGAPGRAKFSLLPSLIPAGTLLGSSQPFFAYGEDATNNDETNLVGALAGYGPPTISLATTAGPVEGTYLASGSWISATIDTGNLGAFGLVSIAGSLPPGTTAAVQVATGATATEAESAPFVGPDGTSGTSFTIGSGLLGLRHDGQPFIRFSVVLTTSDPFVSPSLGGITVQTDLQEYSTAETGLVEIPVTGGPGLESHLLARFSTATVEDYDVSVSYAGGTGLVDVNSLTVRTSHPDVSVAASGGAITTSSGASHPHLPGDSFDLWLDEDVVTGSTVTLDLLVSFRSPKGLVLEKDVRLVISG